MKFTKYNNPSKKHARSNDNAYMRMKNATLNGNFNAYQVAAMDAEEQNNRDDLVIRNEDGIMKQELFGRN